MDNTNDTNNEPKSIGKATIPAWKVLVLFAFIGICAYDGQYLLAAAVCYFAVDKIESSLTFNTIIGIVGVLDLLGNNDQILERRIKKLENKDEQST